MSIPGHPGPGLNWAGADTPLTRPGYKQNWAVSLGRHREHTGRASQPQSQAQPSPSGPTDTLPPPKPSGDMCGSEYSSYLIILSCPFACGSLGFIVIITILFLTCMEHKERKCETLQESSSTTHLPLSGFNPGSPPHCDATSPSPQVAQTLLRITGDSGHGGFLSIPQLT